MDNEPSAQLAGTIRDALIRELAVPRPILHHLNADTSWLLSIPRPEVATRGGGRIYHNILVDPWLAGGQSDIARWFWQQWHATESRVGSIVEVEQLAREMEMLAGGLRERAGNGRKKRDWIETDAEPTTFIDAVTISHDSSNHCHKATLLAVHPDVPVFAPKRAAALIKSWQHFRLVLEAPAFTGDWRTTSTPPLPEWLGISRLSSPDDGSQHRSGLLVTFNARPCPPASSSDADSDDAAECLVYAPRGVHPSALRPVAEASPPLRTLCVVRGLRDVGIGSARWVDGDGQDGLLALRMLRARYWVGTQDEVKGGGGLLSWFLRRKVGSVEEALREEGRRGMQTGGGGGGDGRGLRDVRFEELGNGESRILW